MNSNPSIVGGGTAMLCILLGFACSTTDGTSDTVGQSVQSETLEDFSKPLPGLSAAELQKFNDGKTEFQAVEAAVDGLGPIFNEASCTTCHNQGGIGGGSERVETRFGRVSNNTFDPLTSLGGTLQQDHSLGKVSDGCLFIAPDAIPSSANRVAKRRSTPLFGLGLIDAVPDQTFIDMAANQQNSGSSTAGRTNRVTDIATGNTVVGKFGWKAGIGSLFQFSGDAYLNEMGITNPQFPTENCPSGDCSQMAKCNPVPALNDDGEDVQKFADFMTFMAPPPRGLITSDVTAGDTVFNNIGCADCHTPTLTTGTNPSPALSRKTIHPYSDFLLHDMTDLFEVPGGAAGGDGIGGPGRANTREIRTAPLWGLRAITRFMHDASAASVTEAIRAHHGQGADAAARFNNLSATQQRQILAFLGSL